ncbi:TPA: Gfo/Idh/MocA family oxidoreductase, partial [Candidatus Bathyarchaeota archaeon]|nr:Gfo/Idh/MocA family oxidoreductase [Candidatus Bathyarchaeota archaeon]
MMMKKFKIGIIGVGVIGHAHIKAFSANKKAEVTAIADINPETLKSTSKEFKIKNAFTDYQDLLALDSLDGIAVCTPPFVHAKITCDAASSGKHVLCEKPMAMNSEEARRMVEACNEAGVKLGICSARSRFSPSVKLAKKYINEGKIGQVYYYRATTLRRRGRPGIDILKESKWFLDSSKAGGGALIDIGCYDIDASLYLLGEVQPVSVSAMRFTGIEPAVKLSTVYDVEEHSSVFVRFKEDVTATFETAWASNIGPHTETLIFGSAGGLKLNPFTYYTEEKGLGVSKSFEIPWRSQDIWNQLVDDFITACWKNRNPKTSGEDGLKIMEITEMAYRSAKLKREVNIQELQSY